MYSKRKKMIITILKVFFIFIVPLILVLVVRIDHRRTYEFVDEGVKRMVAPSAPYPYLSSLFSDILLKVGISPYSFCIENNSFSKDYSLPHDLAIKIDDSSSFVKIPYKGKMCVPILKKDILYDVAWGGFVIPSKEWAEKNCKFVNGNCTLSFKINEILNFTVYSKLNLPALIIIYIILASAMFGFLKLLVAVYNFIFL
jgi:hypothetical protein